MTAAAGGPESALPLLAAASVGIQVGAAIVASRFALAELSPITLALLRYAIGVACLLPMALLARFPRIPRADLVPIAGLGVIQFAGVVWLLNASLNLIPAARAAILFATFPLITMLLAAALGHERLSWRRSAGVLLTVAAVALAFADKVANDASGAGAWTGAALAFGAAVGGATCSVLYRPYLRRHPALPIGVVAMAASVLALLPPALPALAATDFAAVRAGTWAAVAFIGISSGVFYAVWLWALRRTSATRVTVFLGLNPIAAALIGVVVLGEPITPQLATAIAVLAAGLWLATRTPTRPTLP